MKQNQKQNGFSDRYGSALQRYLRRGTPRILRAAVGLGKSAVGLGLETLELARIHERTLASLNPIKRKNGAIRRSEVFFAEAITPIVQSRRSARQSKIELKRLTGTLHRRTAALAVTNRLLQKSIVRRKSVETALKISGLHYGKLLKDSLHLQKGLRRLTHRVLTAQEDERKKISRELQDEIAQTLLGINVRLLSLTKDARGNSTGLKNEIDTTQRLVLKSVKSMQRAANRFGGL